MMIAHGIAPQFLKQILTFLLIRQACEYCIICERPANLNTGANQARADIDIQQTLGDFLMHRDGFYTCVGAFLVAKILFLVYNMAS